MITTEQKHHERGIVRIELQQLKDAMESHFDKASSNFEDLSTINEKLGEDDGHLFFLYMEQYNQINQWFRNNIKQGLKEVKMVYERRKRIAKDRENRESLVKGINNEVNDFYHKLMTAKNGNLCGRIIIPDYITKQFRNLLNKTQC